MEISVLIVNKKDAKLIMDKAKEVMAKATPEEREEMNRLLDNAKGYHTTDLIFSGNCMIAFFRLLLKKVALDDLTMRRLINNKINILEELSVVMETTKKIMETVEAIDTAKARQPIKQSIN